MNRMKFTFALAVIASLVLFTESANAQPIQLPPEVVTATRPTPGVTVVAARPTVRDGARPLPKQEFARRVVRSVNRRPF